ncbi:MAG: hypothetical protein V4772_05720, partial [Pseudomonadota bacterium]
RGRSQRLLGFGGAAFFCFLFAFFLSESSIYAVFTAEIGSILPFLLKKWACRRNTDKNNAISTFHTGVINGFVQGRISEVGPSPRYLAFFTCFIRTSCATGVTALRSESHGSVLLSRFSIGEFWLAS